MKRTVAKIAYNGTYRIVVDDNNNYNPYAIYHEYYAGQNRRKIKIASYGDLVSCMYHITEEIIKH